MGTKIFIRSFQEPTDITLEGDYTGDIELRYIEDYLNKKK